ncbi:MAG: hypothetical protein OEY19_11560 [Gammaproteobacteria bacterium]|nr:hypothetical protein [Gammaproteobacteria bacterium]MDH5629696.1 hypothetical protein [Gammaproteobacteria bacterium]
MANKVNCEAREGSLGWAIIHRNVKEGGLTKCYPPFLFLTFVARKLKLL